MNEMLNACGHALLDALRPRVLLLTLAPLAVMLLLVLGLGLAYGGAALEWAHGWVGSVGWLNWVIGWLGADTAAKVQAVLAPLVLVAMVTPLVVVGVLLLVAIFMMPAMRRLVVRTRFAGLKRQGGGARVWLDSLMHSVVVTLVALVLLVLTSPLWLIPPLIVVLPPLIFGWLGYRVMSYDALAEHASPAERRALMRRHRAPLLVVGVVTGYLGTAPVAIWAPGLLLLSLFWLLVPLAVWLYTWTFAFASLWFAHYCLFALQTLRMADGAAPPPSALAPALPGPPVADRLQGPLS
ncbi:MAG: EI24 domain-containing protein [Burkholderiaceae bacterium]|nr:EI24 domain-containing protein [Burkholderiaceae bacterium]